MTPRERMLGRIRQSLGESRPEPSPGVSPIPPAPAADCKKQFAESLKALNGDVRFASGFEQARALAEELVASRPFIASSAPAVARCGFSGSFSRDSAASAQVGITSADFALADTGSLVFLSESAESRLISLLPPDHIAIVEAEKILGGIEELFARVPLPASQSSSMVIVTGPSRTGDIEMRLVRGVHGPGNVTVIVIEDVTDR